jgi:hypothetical protein
VGLDQPADGPAERGVSDPGVVGFPPVREAETEERVALARQIERHIQSGMSSALRS